MAGVEWKGCKCKGGTEAKGKLMHNDKEQRILHEHDNPDIDPSKTPYNFSYRGLSFAQKCRRYDTQVASAKVKRQSQGKNANTTMIGLCIYVPKGLQEDDKYDPKKVKAWFRDVGDILQKRYGDDFLDMDVHVDEVHLYKDSRTEEWEWSRVHGHAAIIPTVIEDGERCLNGKKFASRTAIESLNQAIHEMSLQKYHVPYMDGSGKKGRATIAGLKARSAELLMQAEAELREREQQLDERLSVASDIIFEADARKEYSERLLADAKAADAKAQERLAAMDAREASISKKQQLQDEREKEFQVKEDALDAQRLSLEGRERAITERETQNQELIILGRRAKAVQMSENIQKSPNSHRRVPTIGYEE